MRLALITAVTLATSPVAARSPPLPCSDGEEAGMVLGYARPFAAVASGLIITEYRDPIERNAEGVLVHRNASIPALHGVRGLRVTECSTGRFFVVDDDDAWRMGEPVLLATEFLREDVQAWRPSTFADARRAADAVYGVVGDFRETAETCGCAFHFSDLRPDNMTPFADRSDIGTYQGNLQ